MISHPSLRIRMELECDSTQQIPTSSCAVNQDASQRSTPTPRSPRPADAKKKEKKTVEVPVELLQRMEERLDQLEELLGTLSLEPPKARPGFSFGALPPLNLESAAPFNPPKRDGATDP